MIKFIKISNLPHIYQTYLLKLVPIKGYLFTTAAVNVGVSSIINSNNAFCFMVKCKLFIKKYEGI